MLRVGIAPDPPRFRGGVVGFHLPAQHLSVVERDPRHPPDTGRLVFVDPAVKSVFRRRVKRREFDQDGVFPRIVDRNERRNGSTVARVLEAEAHVAGINVVNPNVIGAILESGHQQRLEPALGKRGQNQRELERSRLHALPGFQPSDRRVPKPGQPAESGRIA